MKQLNHLLTAALLFLCGAMPLFAIPGIKDYMPTSSGQYVYYRDYTYQNETYIGFLFYDDYTFQIRYYSPDSTDHSQNIELLVSFNPEKNGIELSGERIISETKSEDVDMLNYLHELLYSLSEHRRNINSRDLSKTVSVKEDFFQFGGSVTIAYEPFVPVFNLRSITSSDGEVLFELVKTGALSDSNDTSFADFAGIPQPENTETVTFTPDKKAKKSKVSADGATFKIDSQWSQTADNIWTLGDAAVLLVYTIQFEDNTFSNLPYTAETYLTRMFSFTDSDTVQFFKNFKVTDSKKVLRIDGVTYDTATNAQVHSCKYLLKVNANSFRLLELTVYDSVYNSNTAYFDKILTGAKATGKK